MTRTASTDTAWRRVKPFRNVGGARQEHFDSAQVRALVAKAATFDRRFADLIEVAYLTGARLGELAGATVNDFDAERTTLRVDGKTGPRDITLTTRRSPRYSDRRGSDRQPRHSCHAPTANGGTTRSIARCSGR